MEALTAVGRRRGHGYAVVEGGATARARRFTGQRHEKRGGRAAAKLPRPAETSPAENAAPVSQPDVTKRQAAAVPAAGAGEAGPTAGQARQKAGLATP